MIHTEEQIFIVFAYKNTYWKEYVDVAEKAVLDFKLESSQVKSAVSKISVFNLPAGSGSGKTLNSELITHLQCAIGAIVFVDFLRPNVTYELGFFHGQGKPVLLVTKGKISQMWRAFSDLTGVSILDITRKDPKNQKATSNRKVIPSSLPLTENAKDQLKQGILEYLKYLYHKLGQLPFFQISEIPLAHKNILKQLVEIKGDKRFRSQFPVIEADYGSKITVGTWRGLVMRPGYNLLPDAKFKILLRSDEICHYSIYFLVHFLDSINEKRIVQVGVSSRIHSVAFESNERNLPGQRITDSWGMLAYSFKELLSAGQILGENKVFFLENIRVRAGLPDDKPEETKSYDIGYFEIIGIDS